MEERYEEIKEFTQSFTNGESFTDRLKYIGFIERLHTKATSGLLRTEKTWGNFIEPQVGRGFLLVSTPLSGLPEGIRHILTSNILEIEMVGDKEMIFLTENGSRYRAVIAHHRKNKKH